jgi:hypothetical protein
MKVYETVSFRMTIHDNLLKEFVVKKNATLSEEDIRLSMRYSEEHRPGAKFFVLVEGEDGGRISPEARRLAASPEYSQATAALALYSPNVLMAIAGNLFLKINRPKVPSRFFDQRANAIAWLDVMRSAAVTPGGH